MTTTTTTTTATTQLQPSAPIFSNEELLNYTSLRHEQCWIRDIFSMEPYKEQPKEYYMLGRIPCRNVQIVGICVGAQEFEKRWKVIVDDGTGVIECVYRIEPQSPSKRTREPARSMTIADVGWPLRVTGKVAQWFETRELHNVTIERVNYNDEPQHWKQVRHLHDTHYDIDEPFIIPAKPVSSREKERTQQHLQRLTPKPNSTATTMQAPAVKDPINELPRLRHPSRLHTDQLTENVLAIYVLHYLHHSWNTFSPSSTSSEQRGYPLSYLRRIPELSLLAQRVVKAEAKRQYRLKKQKDSTQRRYRPTGSDLARKMKKLFDNAVIRLMRDGNLVVWQGPVHRAPATISPVDGPWKTQKSVDSTMSSTMTMTQDDEEVELSEPEDEEEEEAYAPTSGCLPIVLRERLFKLRGLNFKDKNVVMTEAILKELKRDEQWKWIGQWHLEEALKSYDGVYYVRGGWRATG